MQRVGEKGVGGALGERLSVLSTFLQAAGLSVQEFQFWRDDPKKSWKHPGIRKQTWLDLARVFGIEVPAKVAKGNMRRYIWEHAVPEFEHVFKSQHRKPAEMINNMSIHGLRLGGGMEKKSELAEKRRRPRPAPKAAPAPRPDRGRPAVPADVAPGPSVMGVSVPLGKPRLLSDIMRHRYDATWAEIKEAAQADLASGRRTSARAKGAAEAQAFPVNIEEFVKWHAVDRDPAGPFRATDWRTNALRAAPSMRTGFNLRTPQSVAQSIQSEYAKNMLGGYVRRAGGGAVEEGTLIRNKQRSRNSMETTETRLPTDTCRR